LVASKVVDGVAPRMIRMGSDEATAPGLPNFTGAFVGMACQDISGSGCPADFDWFEYVERPYRADRFGTGASG
jgi:hypothetical protein